MKPLHWPDFYQAASYEQKTFAEQLRLVSRFFFSDYRVVIADIHEQLLTRAKPDIKIWGDEPKRTKTALYVCAVLRKEYDWPNDHFIPDDPFEIVFQIPWDDLQIVEVIMRFEAELEIEIKDSEAEGWSGGLGNIVDFLVAKQS